MLDKPKSETGARFIVTDLDGSRLKYNRETYEVAHRLSSHPLLQLPKLLELAERTVKSRPDDVYFDMGKVRTGQRWNEVPQARFSAIEAMQQLETSDAWFIFRAVQRDPLYKDLFDQIIKEVKEIAGQDIEAEIRQEEIIIFVTSPKRVTAYHIDRECSFLLQIRGTKTLHVFDRDDEDVLPNEEIERFWAVDNNAPVYRPEYQDHAISYRLAPGCGVHIPVNFPHWLQNDDNISISLNINFHFLDSKRANLYRSNYHLRRLGLNPSRPGASRIRDAAKSFAMTCALAVRRLVRGSQRKERIWN